ncbi:uncharacterized protein LOC113287093 isoform X1 [Papaver somniferum]|uniref:uncharacterized protein LOC113287093 isoform X1 n=1 Tax=Papaver somniferum TaxID=3469 RepID=UPI000E6F6E06|nr:uncharacterized protein LOC113287093 isoform X1 [Papaver somniferum]
MFRSLWCRVGANLQTTTPINGVPSPSSSRINGLKQLRVNVKLLRCEGVPESYIIKYLIIKPRSFMADADKFNKIVEKLKGMGFDPLATTFLQAIERLTSMTEATWRKKMDVYKRRSWSEDHLHTAFRKCPSCMKASEKKITAVMDFLVNEIGYD